MDGVASLKPEERLTYARQLRYLSRWTVDPIRRTYIPKPSNPTEKRGLGIPTMRYPIRAPAESALASCLAPRTALATYHLMRRPA